MQQSPNFENIVFLYVCREKIFKIVDPDFFKNPYVSKLYAMTKGFYHKFKSLPFDMEHPKLDQITQVAHASPKAIIIDKDKTTEDNIKAFLTHAEHVIKTDIKQYSPKWLKDVADAWIMWESSQKGYKDAIEYQKLQNITPENVLDVIRTARNIVTQRTGIVIDEDRGADFDDPEAHKQTDPENLVNTGFKHLNEWVSGRASGGLEPGTLTILAGESNIGKSIWLGNIAYNMYLNGYNVLLISLEMSTAKIYKRIGANAFNLDVNTYGDVSNDTDRVAEYIRDFKEKNLSAGIPLGKFRSKKFTHATALDIEAFAKSLEDELNLKWHAVVIDYMTELENAHGITIDNMYMYHKSNTNDLYMMSGDNNWAVLTAHQLAARDYGATADDITLQSLGESRGIIHRTDNIIGIVQPPELKADFQYELKNLKTRDGKYKNYKIVYDIDYDHMRLKEQEGMKDPMEI